MLKTLYWFSKQTIWFLFLVKTTHKTISSIIEITDYFGFIEKTKGNKSFLNPFKKTLSAIQLVLVINHPVEKLL